MTGLLFRGYIGGFGGGIANEESGRMTVIDSTIRDNTASPGDPAVGSPYSAGGGIYNDGELTVIGSTISSNMGTFGGGMDDFGGNATLWNSTLSSNTALFTIASRPNFGVGGIDVGNATLALISSTVTGNVGLLEGGVYGEAFSMAFNSQKFLFSGAIIAGNTGPTAPDFGTAQYCNPGVVNGPCFDPIIDHTLIGNNTGSHIPGGNNGNIIGTGAAPIDAKLGPLADNGGPTRTHALQPGSPAIDVAGAPCLQTDQRGFARPQGSGCDIGSFEVGPTAIGIAPVVAPAGRAGSAGVNGPTPQPVPAGPSAVPPRPPGGGGSGAPSPLPPSR